MKQFRTSISMGFVVTSIMFMGLVSQAAWVNYQPIYAIDFSTDTNGTPPVVVPAPTGPPLPVTHPDGAQPDWVNPPYYTIPYSPVTVTVGDVPGLSKAVIINNNATNGALATGYVDLTAGNTGFQAPSAVMSFDINQIKNSTEIFSVATNYYQTLYQVYPGYGYEPYTNVNLGWEGRVRYEVGGGGGLFGVNFAWVPTSATGGVFTIMNPNRSETVVGSFVTGTVTHVDVMFDYINGNYGVALNGTPVASGLPYVYASGGSNDQVNEIFMYNWVAGSGSFADQNITAFDNINYTLVPEPSPALLAGIGLVTLGVIFRQVRRKA